MQRWLIPKHIIICFRWLRCKLVSGLAGEVARIYYILLHTYSLESILEEFMNQNCAVSSLTSMRKELLAAGLLRII